MKKLKINFNQKNYWLLLLVFVGFVVFAQNPNRIYKGSKLHQNHLEIITNEGIYFIKPYNTKIIETTFIPNGEQFNPNSHAVVLIPVKQKFKLKENAQQLEYISPGITVKIDKSPFKIAYFFKDNEKIISFKFAEC